MYLNLGTGLAAGIVVDGVPLRGADGYAGEIGHLPISPVGRLCPCGQHGCLETVASGSALKTYWPSAGEHPGRTLISATESGDADAVQALDLLVDGAATAIRIMGLTINPDTIVIGGGLRLIGDPLMGAIREKLDGWARESEFLAALKLTERIQILPDDSPVAAVGAALAAHE